jgi:hypothetical protein
MDDRDGAEPQVLLLLVVALAVLTIVAAFLFDKLPVAWRIAAVSVCFIVSIRFAMRVPFAPPMAQVDSEWRHILAVEAGVLLMALAVEWTGRRRSTYGLLLLVLIPLSFISASPQSVSPDLSFILAPALRLYHGFPLREIYFQYDLFPSLVAAAWKWLGADPSIFSFCTRTSYFLLLTGLFLLARRLFAERRLAGLFVVALCAVRIYGNVVEANANPQVTPMRIDLWILLLAAALFFGIEHWSVGLIAGLLFFFARSFGMLYLGSYALALAINFCARRARQQQHMSLFEDVASSLRRATPALVLILASIVAARVTFGSFFPDAVLKYRGVGLGMMRVTRGSFFWWIAPGLAIVAYLVFRFHPILPEKRAQAAFFAVTLAIGNLIYFFGRSHENNLINVSASLLLCFFLGVDLAIFALKEARPRWMSSVPLVMSWIALVAMGFFYSGKIYGRVASQASAVAQPPAPPLNLEFIRCEEINAAVPDRRIFVFSGYDYWFYERCGYVPQGYVQPLWANVMRADVIAQMDLMLRKGYRILVPKPSAGDLSFAEFVEGLPEMQRIETANYYLYSSRSIESRH